jgi:hypothetical protein
VSRAATLWERLIGPVLDFAGERYRETQESIALGGASLAQELRGNASRPSPADFEIPFHARSNTKEGQRNNG